jgi:prepilin-type N-terminal cleavage/methylation domain-containing protein
MKRMLKHTRDGFTIVELLIVIVVIAILAAISVVTYTGIQNRANDSSVQSDIKNLAKQFELYRAENDVYPAGAAQLTDLNIRLNKRAYGNGFSNGAHNVLYCRVAADGPDKFAILAASQSGTVFVYSSTTGAITTLSSWPGNASSTICQSVGINQIDTNDRDVLFVNNAWVSYVGG